jgi:hypothetical protein
MNIFTIGKCSIFKKGLQLPVSSLSTPQYIPCKVSDNNSITIEPQSFIIGYTKEQVMYLPKDWRSWVLDVILEKHTERGLLIIIDEKKIREGGQIYFMIQNITQSPATLLLGEPIFEIDIQEIVNEEKKTRRKDKSS